MKQRAKRISTFYTEKQVCFENIQSGSFSKSPLKPYLLMQRIKKKGLNKHFSIKSDFEPFTKEDFTIAHTEICM